MPTKKSTSARKAQPARKQGSSPQKTSSSATDSRAVWKWVYVGGIIVAGLVKIFPGLLPMGVDQGVAWLLLLAAILSGIFFLDSDDIVNFAIRFLLFFFVYNFMSGFEIGSFAIGGHLTDFFRGALEFLAQAGLTLSVVYFWKKYFTSKM